MTRNQLDAIRARVEAAMARGLSTQIEIDRDGTTRWINVGPYPCSTHEDAAQVRDIVTFIHAVPTDACDLLAEVERLTAERDALKPKASTVCTFQFPNGKWGWVVSPGPISGGPPMDTHEEAVAAGKALAHRERWPEIRALPDPEDK